MKNILNIYKRDIKNIFKNWVAVVILCGLIILPATYAWFNIRASWDPYGSTSGIKIAVVNQDKGTALKEKNINIGDKVVEELSTNNQIGWVFTDEKKAAKGVEKGKYFASIVIPDNFSENLVSPLKQNISKPKLVYTVNESANAIAPKITDKGVASLKEKVDKTVAETVNGAIFRAMNDLGVEYNSNRDRIRKVIDVVYTVNDSLPKIETLLDEAYEGTISLDTFNQKIGGMMPAFETTLGDVSSTLEKGQNLVSKTKDSINQAGPLIKEDLTLADNIVVSAESLLNGLSKEDALTVLPAVDEKIVKVDKVLNANIKILESVNKVLHSDKIAAKTETLKDAETKLNGIHTEINKAIDDLNNGGQIEAAVTSVKTKLGNIHTVLSGIVNSFDSEILPAINGSLDKLDHIAVESSALIAETENVMPDVQNLMGKLDAGTKFTQDEIVLVREKFPEFKTRFGNLTEKVKSFDNEEEIDKAIDLLAGDWEGRAGFIANPVEVETNKLFSVPNYGSAMSPFYTTLALWVGCLILISILTFDSKPLKEGVELKPVEKYFGKYLLFGSIAILQGAVVTLGDVFVLKTYVIHPVYFVLFGMFASLVFATIIYSTVSVFGNVGKAICIIFLVLQVAASGGTFPVEVMSGFFQAINPYLPFRYAIEAMRGFVGGIVPELIRRDIMFLLIVALVFMIFAVLTKGKVNKMSEKLHEKATESGILEH